MYSMSNARRIDNLSELQLRCLVAYLSGNVSGDIFLSALEYVEGHIPNSNAEMVKPLD